MAVRACFKSSRLYNNNQIRRRFCENKYPLIIINLNGDTYTEKLFSTKLYAKRITFAYNSWAPRNTVINGFNVQLSDVDKSQHASFLHVYKQIAIVKHVHFLFFTCVINWKVFEF